LVERRLKTEGVVRLRVLRRIAVPAALAMQPQVREFGPGQAASNVKSGCRTVKQVEAALPGPFPMRPGIS